MDDAKKTRLVNKIKAKNAEKEAAERSRESALDAFKADFSDLENWLLQLVGDIPSVEVKSLPASADDELFDQGQITIELFGNKLTFCVAKDSGKFGVNVDNLWSRPTFLTTKRLNVWGWNGPSGEQLVLTDAVILDKLDKFVDKPVEKGVKLWD